MHGNAKAFLSVCSSVCLSVRLSMRALWQNERNLCVHSYTIWKNVYPNFPTRGTVGGGRPLALVPDFFKTKLISVEQKPPIFNWYSLVAPQPLHLAKKFNTKIALYLKKVCYKVSVCDYKAYLAVQKWFSGDVHYYVKIWPKLTNPFKNADFSSTFARSSSAVISSKKVQWTRRRSPLWAFQWAYEQCTSTLAFPALKRKVSEI